MPARPAQTISKVLVANRGEIACRIMRRSSSLMGRELSCHRAQCSHNAESCKIQGHQSLKV